MYVHNYSYAQYAKLNTYVCNVTVHSTIVLHNILMCICTYVITYFILYMGKTVNYNCTTIYNIHTYIICFAAYYHAIAHKMLFSSIPMSSTATTN